MQDQPKYVPLRPMEPIGSVTDGRSARPLVEGTVARGELKDDVEFYTGRLRTGATASAAPTTGGSALQTVSQYQGFVTEFPVTITAADLDRGQERFNIYCSVCHGMTGEGDGMIVRRGFRKPPSFHDERLRQAPVGYFFDVETNGFGAMPDYSAQIPAEDRWRIIAYIRALQLSHTGTVADVPSDQRGKLSGPQPPNHEGAGTQGEHKQ